MKVVINTCYGGFGLSLKAHEYYYALQGKKLYFYRAEKWLDRKSLFHKIENIDYNASGHNIYAGLNDINEGYFEDIGFVYDFNIARNDPYLVKTVEDLGEESFGFAAQLEVIEIPDDVDWEISEYDGAEHIAERHRTWS